MTTVNVGVARCVPWLVVGMGALPAPAQVQQNDAVIGYGISSATGTLQLVRAGAAVSAPWNTGTQQWIRFDNTGGIAHNPAGNLLTVNQYNSTLGSGVIRNAATNGSSASEKIGDTVSMGVGAGGVVPDYLNGLSVNPANSRIALTGGDTGRLYVFDYNPGAHPGTGAGASLSGGRQTPPFLPTFFEANHARVQGTCWLDDNTILAFSAHGSLWTVDARTMNHSLLETVSVPLGSDLTVLSITTDLAYQPAISPYVYASIDVFDVSTGTESTRLYVLDPRAGFTEVHPGGWDFTATIHEARGIALDSAGGLLEVTFGNTTSPCAIWRVAGAASPQTLQDNQAVLYFQSTTAAAFPGLDVASGVVIPPRCVGDLNFDGHTNTADLAVFLQHYGQTVPVGTRGDLDGSGTVNTSDLALFLQHYGC